jgi:hypothetical protein
VNNNGLTVPEQASEFLCEKSDQYYSRKAKSVKLLLSDFMNKVNQEQASRAVNHAVDITGMRPSTVRGYKQVWHQHLKAHFGATTLRNYSAVMARRFLQSIKTQQGKNTLKHIRALASAMFTEAIERDLCPANPWKVRIPKDCKDL